MASRREPIGAQQQLLASLLGLWMTLGLFLDGWAHDNEKPETFFTPWHGVLYAGFAAAAGFAAYIAWKSRTSTFPTLDDLPQGHALTLAGLASFGAAALSDLAWHEGFGIEVGLEALLSPTHLWLMASGIVALSAPIRAAWRDDDVADSLRRFMPVALTTALLAALSAFFLIFFSPFSNGAGGTPYSRRPGTAHAHPSTNVAELQQLLGVASVIVMTVVFATAVAFLLRRWRTPYGTFTLLFGLLVLLLAGADEFTHPLVALSGVIAGVVADRLARRRPAAMVCAASIAVLWASYFALYALDAGAVDWAAEVWLGSVFLAALLAAGIGLLVTPLD